MSNAPRNRLEHYPITFFAIGMGLMGLTLALHAASGFYPLAEPASAAMLRVGIGALAVIAFFYLFKLMRHPAAVAWEWHHPVRLAFFPTMTISLLLLATAMAPHWPELARIGWLTGVAGQGILTVAVISGWISHRGFEVGHLTPAWFIPAVGNVIVPVAGVEMGYLETSWAFFAVGMVFWGILLTLVMNRLMFHDPIPARLFPTMVILIAPPSVAFVAYVKMTGGIVDGFSRTLIYVGYFFAALMLLELPKIARLPFALSWWALSFPLAALAIASFMFARIEHTDFHLWVGTIVLGLLALLVAGLILRTALGIWRGEFCKPE